MLSRVECLVGHGKMKLQSDVYGAYFSCITCGSQRDAVCPHCNTDSIILRPWSTGTQVVCKACGCQNGEFTNEVCSRKREPGLIMA